MSDVRYVLRSKLFKEFFNKGRSLQCRKAKIVEFITGLHYYLFSNHQQLIG